MKVLLALAAVAVAMATAEEMAAETTTKEMAAETTTKDCLTILPPTGEPCPTTSGQAFVYPDPDHCSRYWECYDGCASHLICQEDYLFDDAHGWCNFPEDVSCGDRDCDGRPCKANPTTLHPYDFICPAAEGFFADPDNCMKYYQCLGWIPNRISCPVGGNGEQELYNAEEVYCDFPDRVECHGIPICDSNDSNCYEVTDPPPSFCDMVTCPPSGVVFIPQGDCAQCVCECSQGNAYEICCGNDLVWDNDLEECNWFYNMGCPDPDV